jgi:phosphoglycolate phosphatase
MTPRLIIFDCDGTLADGQHMIARAMTAAFEGLEMTPPPRETVMHVIGLSPLECMRALAPDADAPLHDALVSGYRANFQALRRGPDFAEPLFPGARDAVLRLARERDMLLAIATGKSQRGVRAVLEREGLLEAFATIQTADDAPSKPHPGMILNALNETGANAAQAVMIGDTTHDMLMARAAGVRAIGVAWGYHPAEALRLAGAAAIAENFNELLRCLDDGGDVS